MTDRPPLRLIPSPRTAMHGASREAADAATVEAILDGLPPGGRVRIAGEAPWLAAALEALGITIVTDAAVPVDAVAFPLAAADASALLAARTGLDLGGRIVVEAVHPAGLRPYEDALVDAGGEPTAARTFASWVRVLASAGLVLRSVREPLEAHSGTPAGLVLVAEPEE